MSPRRLPRLHSRRSVNKVYFSRLRHTTFQEPCGHGAQRSRIYYLRTIRRKHDWEVPPGSVDLISPLHRTPKTIRANGQQYWAQRERDRFTPDGNHCL